MAKKRGSPIDVDPIEKIKAIMNNRHTPVQVQLRAAIALLDHENGKRAIAGEPGVGAGGSYDGLTALLRRAQMENKRSTPPGGRPPAGDLKSATAAETASKPAAASEPEAPPAEAPKKPH